MNNYQTRVIRAQIDLLWHIRKTHATDLTVNQVYWIDFDITYIEVKYFKETNGSKLEEEYLYNKPKTLDFLEALEILTVRLHNTIDYLEKIIDPEQT